MLKRLSLILTITSLVAVYYGLPITHALAATTGTNSINAGQALEIAPPVITLKVNPGQSVSVPIYLRDIAKTNLIVTGQANDFVAAGEDGTPKLLLDNNQSDPYSMSSWVVSLPSLTLIPREIKAMTVRLQVPKNATPGGHYGVIRFTATPPNLDATGVSLSASLGALLLVTVNGQIKEDVSIQEFSVNQNGHASSFFEAPPVSFVERFKNNGNVHEQPTGQVTVTDMFGRKFAVVNVNVPITNVLPDSTRKYEQVLDSAVIGNNAMFGRYTADLKATYGANKRVLTSQLTFWVIPYRLIAIIVIGLVGGFFALRFFIRRYNRFIIGQAQRGRGRY